MTTQESGWWLEGGLVGRVLKGAKFKQCLHWTYGSHLRIRFIIRLWYAL
jgi:hypothetical protein